MSTPVESSARLKKLKLAFEARARERGTVEKFAEPARVNYLLVETGPIIQAGGARIVGPLEDISRKSESPWTRGRGADVDLNFLSVLCLFSFRIVYRRSTLDADALPSFVSFRFVSFRLPGDALPISRAAWTSVTAWTRLAGLRSCKRVCPRNPTRHDGPTTSPSPSWRRIQAL